MKLQKFFDVVEVSMILLSLFLHSAHAQTEFWQQTNGPLGGTVEKVIVNKTNGYVFAAIDGNVIVRSTNNGENWEPVNSGLADRAVQALAINSQGNLFAGTNQGIYYSSDNGESWTPAYTGSVSTSDIQSLFINPQNDEIFAGTSFANNGSVLRSDNNGASWKVFTTGLNQAGNIQTLTINSSTGDIFAGTSTAGVLRSNNRGESWSPANTGLINPNIRVLTVTSNGSIFAGADSSITKHAIFRSTDNGANWIKLLEVTRSVLSFAVNSSSAIYAGTEGEGVYVSANNGNSWAQSTNGFRSYVILSLAMNATDQMFAGTHCTGVFRSTDNGASWTAINKDLKYTHASALAVHQTTGAVFAGTDCGGVFRSMDDGDNWVWTGLPNRNIAALFSHPNGTIFAGTQGVDIFLGAGGDIYRSMNNGDTWEEVSADDDFFLSFAVAPNGDIYAGIGYFQLCGFSFCDWGDIFHSSNNGGRWTRVATKLDDHVQALAVNATGRVVAGTPEGIFRRSGEFWHKVSASNTHSLLFHPASGYFFAGTSGGIFRSTDDAETWSMVNSLPGNFTWSFAIDPDGNTYAATEKGGVLRSTDNGITWESVGSGLTINNVQSLAIHQANGRIFAGTDGRGVFRSEPTTTAVDETIAELPSSFKLAQNYPNPFNPETTIEYVIPVNTSNQEHVRLHIYNIQGQLVRTLVDEQKSPGLHRTIWDGRNKQGVKISSGVYLYTITAGSFKATKRMTLLQ